MRTCVYCDKDLPESTRKGGRRKEFCNDACKNRHYRQYKQIKHDADMLADPFWEEMYKKLYDSYVQLGTQTKDKICNLAEMQKAMQKDIDELEDSVRFWRKRYEDLRLDYAARMKALGVSKDAIEEFNKYWQEQDSIPLFREMLDDSTSDSGPP